jgi:hypothetical protein
VLVPPAAAVVGHPDLDNALYVADPPGGDKEYGPMAKKAVSRPSTDVPQKVVSRSSTDVPQRDVDVDPHSKFVAEVFLDVRSRLKGGMSDEAQAELAQAVALLPDIEQLGDAALLEAAAVAIEAVLCDPPNLKLARDIRTWTSKRISGWMWHSLRPSALFGTTAPAVRVVLGMMALLYLAIPLSIRFGQKFMATELFPGLSNSVLAIVAVAGALGSIVSIMVRIQDFKGSVIGGRGSVLFFTGFFKPIIGAGFALFVFAALSAKFIPITVESARETYVFAALAL